MRNYTYKIYPESKLFLSRFSGEIEYLDIMAWFDEVLEDNAFLNSYDGIVDLRATTFRQTRPEKARFLANYMIDKDFTSGKWAVLVDKPMETAISVIYSRIASQKHPIEIFSTVNAAAEFLGKDFEELNKRMSG